MTPVHRSSLNIWCALIGIAAAGCLAEGTADQDDMAAGLPAPELSKASQASEAAVVKPVPVKPQDTPGVKTDGSLPDKPAPGPTATPAAESWTVSLVASPPSQWAGVFTTLTATTNIDVGPTPYFIRIWDDERGAYIASCGVGTSCSVNITRTGPRATSFKVVVANSGGIAVASAFASAYWHVSGLRLTESETTVGVSAPVLLTTFTDYDIGVSPYWVQIYDDTARTILRSCGAGTMCSVNVSQATATTHRFSACFTEYSASYPPQNILECTPQKSVTWTGTAGIRVFLQPTSPTMITATASIDVGPTPYWIQIYKNTGERLIACGSGTTCNVTSSVTTPILCVDNLVAHIGTSSATLPDMERAALATSRMFPVIQWAGPMQSVSVGPTVGAAVGPCPSPHPH